MNSTLKLAIQKKGRLHDQSMDLLQRCGLRPVAAGKDSLRATVRNFPMEILYLRNSDIPRYLDSGVADAAVIGENLLEEYPGAVRSVQALGFSRCRVSLAVPKNTTEVDTAWFDGKRIATSYPQTLQNWLAANQLTAEVHRISGSVEIAPNIGLADAICDIVSTGSTLFNNGLREAEVIAQSQATLAISETMNAEKTAIFEKLLFRIQAVLRARSYKYLLMNVPNERIDAVTALLPVLKSPTIMPLRIEGWSSLHTVVEEERFWEVIDALKAEGAEDILVTPVEKIIR